MKRSATHCIGILLLVYSAWTPAASAATDADKQTAIRRGLSYLYNTQQMDGSWNTPGFERATTGAAAFAILSNQHQSDIDVLRFQAAVDKAVAYLLNSAQITDVSAREDGINICPDHAPACKGIFWLDNLDNKDAVGTTALVAPAIAAYGAKHGPDAIAATGGPLAGMTWAQIAQGITNALAAAQSTGKDAGVAGAWRLATDSGLRSNRWGVQPAVISFLYDQTLGAVTPQPVKTSIAAWLSRMQKESGCSDNPNVGLCDHDNIGQWLLAFAFVGPDSSEIRVDQVITDLNRIWPSTADQRGRGNFGHPLTMWSVYAGLESVLGLSDTTHISNFLTDCGVAARRRPTSLPGTSTCTWAEDYNQWIVNGQRLDGSWAGYSQWSTPLASALYVNILGAVQIPSAAYRCPLRQAFWQTSRVAWPVESLSVGGKAYSRNELLAILGAPVSAGGSDDASLLLADELITAKLNLARGSEKTPVASVIADADMLLSNFQSRLPFQIEATSATGLNMIEKANLLDRYNGGAMTSGCVTGEGRNGAPGGLRRTEAPVQQGAPLVAANGSASGLLASVGSAQKARESAASTKVRPFTRKGVTSLALTPDGNFLATASTDNQIRVWEPTTGTQKLVLPAVNFPTSLAFGPNGATLDGVDRDSLVHMWSATSGTELATFAGHESALRAVAASPNGLIGSAGEETRIILWDSVAHKLSGILFGSTDFVNALSFSPDGSLLASAGEDARVLLFDVAAGKVRFTLRGHSGPVDTVSFSPDGKLLASGGQDTVIHVWDPATGVQRLALTGPQAPIHALAFSPDSQTIAAGGGDTRIILWDANTGQIQKTLSGATGAINALVFSPVGPFLVSGTETGEISIWNVVSGIKMFTFVIPI